MISVRYFFILIIYLAASHICLAQNEYQFTNINIRNGLIDNAVKAVANDEFGFIWIATSNGLDKYDGLRFKHYKHSDGITQNNDITELLIDAGNNIWVNTYYGYFAYNRQLDTLEHNVDSRLKQLGINAYNRYALHVDNDKNLWCATKDTLFHYNYAKNALVRIPTHLNKTPIVKVMSTGNTAFVIFADKTLASVQLGTRTFNVFGQIPNDIQWPLNAYMDCDKNIWVYSNSTECGLSKYDIWQHKWIRYDVSTGLSDNYINSLADVGHGRIWIATDKAGIDILDKESGTVIKQLRNIPGNTYSIPNNHIKSLFIDKQQEIIWVGTNKSGFSYANLNDNGFVQCHVGYDDITSVGSDHQGNTWVCTDGNGLTRIAPNGHQTTFTKGPTPQSIADNTLICQYTDSKGVVWFGTFLGGVSIYNNGVFSNLKIDPSIPNTFSGNGVWAIDEDKSGYIWIGTLYSGLQRYNRNNNTFTTYHHTDGIPSESITCLFCQQSDTLFIGTTSGMGAIDTRNNKIWRIRGNKKGNQQLGSILINCIIKDRRGFIWIGSGKGISILDQKRDTIASLSTAQGLSNDYIRGLIEDDLGNIWATTDIGLTHIIVGDNNDSFPQLTCYRYLEDSGKNGVIFNNRAIGKSNDGKILMAGVGGYLIADPQNMHYNQYMPNVMFAGLTIGNKKISPLQEIDKNIPLRENINIAKQITLLHSDNSFTIELSALDFTSPSRNRFAYKIDEIDSDWINLSGSEINFNRLATGNYTLLVKASNCDGYWNPKPSSINISILPPFWRTNIAYIIYFMLALSSAFAVIYFSRRRHKFVLRMQRLEMESEKIKQITEDKQRFYTNISHDFRTPLSLIITPIEKLICSAKDNETLENMQLIHRNASQLLNMVNQLLDLKKIDRNNDVLKLTHGDIVALINDVCLNFNPYIESRKMHIEIDAAESAKTDFDPDKMRRVFMNLLSNATKFSPDGSHISIIIKNKESHIIISIADQGIGIADDQKQKIFDRFFQIRQPKVNTGSGIGLHIVKEYVEMHNGRIEVTDNKPNGSIFTIQIPIINANNDNAEIQQPANNDKPNLLVVEDDNDFRHFLIQCLTNNYNVFSASNGQKAIDLLNVTNIDVVITDVMMPIMDGIELCQRIKSNIEFSHIPVIMLTARTSNEQILNGLKEGADEYITKPFNLDILLLRIANVINRSQQRHEAFAYKDVSPSEITISSLDEKLLEKAVTAVENNMDNVNFSVEELSNTIGLSRGHLYKKLISITGKTPIEFIRILRLKRSLQYLEQSQMTISEIAYEVGMTPKVFTRYFKDEYNCLPSEYKRNKNNANS